MTQAARVLVVDDEPQILRVFRRVLAQVGYEVFTAGDGRAAVAAIDTTHFDVVISDIEMPDIDGLELLRLAHARDPDLAFVLVTGGPAIESAVEALELGALHYLTKPIDREKLERTVEHAVAYSRAAHAKRAAVDLAEPEEPPASPSVREGFERALGSLWMAYQPIVRVSDRSLLGFEALMRSNEPSLPHPGAVLDAATRLSRLYELGREVRARAAAPMQASPEGALVFVNLHPDDLADDALYDGSAPLAAIASRVVLEITERASLGDMSDAKARIGRLRALGYRIAIDDLGAGYAGLTSFALLEPELVKLDMGLVRDVDSNPTRQKLVQSMTTLAHDMGAEIIGEGVETAAEREVLASLGVDLLQGYLLAKPAKPFPTFKWA